jgi:hypothetical protein
MKHLPKLAVVAVALFLSLAATPARHSCASPNGKQTASAHDAKSGTKTKGKMVYVCACLKTKSCACMTEAKTEGPCACGTEGGPPMKAVPANGAWAKANRQALAK